MQPYLDSLIWWPGFEFWVIIVSETWPVFFVTQQGWQLLHNLLGNTRPSINICFVYKTEEYTGWETKIFGTRPNWVVSHIAYTKFHSPRPVFHSPSQIFTRIGERGSASFPAWYIDGLAPDCSNSNANALELLQYCAKPSLRRSFHQESNISICCRVILWESIYFSFSPLWPSDTMWSMSQH